MKKIELKIGQNFDFSQCEVGTVLILARAKVSYKIVAKRDGVVYAVFRRAVNGRFGKEVVRLTRQHTRNFRVYRP